MANRDRLPRFGCAVEVLADRVVECEPTVLHQQQDACSDELLADRADLVDRTPGQFTAPTRGTNGNQRPGQFRQPNFSETDVAFYKRTPLTDRFNVELRLEFYNLFNNKNLYLENNLASPGFGKARSQQLPRWWQFGAKLTF